MEKRQNHERMNSESESERLVREPWQEKPGWKHTRIGVAERKRVRERRRARIERGAEDVSVEPGKHDEQMAVRHADAVTSQKTSTKRTE